MSRKASSTVQIAAMLQAAISPTLQPVTAVSSVNRSAMQAWVARADVTVRIWLA
ncbi:hypothetical protein ACVWXO_000671 [Bradyrhizobium sp. LM2.7]